MILFSAAIKLIVKTVEKIGRGPVTISGIRQPHTRAGRHDYYSKISAEWTLGVTRYKTTDLLVNYEVLTKSRSLVQKEGESIRSL